MAFNKGYELKKFEAHWEKLRIEYAEAGMADDAIQKMYDYDRQQFNSERTCIERTQKLRIQNPEKQGGKLLFHAVQLKNSRYFVKSEAEFF